MWEEVAAADSHREEGYEDGFVSLLLEAGNSRRFPKYRHFGLQEAQEATRLAAAAAAAAAGVLGVGIDIVVAVADHVDMVPAAVAAVGIDVDHAGTVVAAAVGLGRIGVLVDAANRLVQLAIQRQDAESLLDMPVVTVAVVVEHFDWQCSCCDLQVVAAAMTVEVVVVQPADIQGPLPHGWGDNMADWFGQAVAIAAAAVGAAGERSESVLGRTQMRWMGVAKCSISIAS